MSNLRNACLFFLVVFTGLSGCKPLTKEQVETIPVSPYRLVDKVNDTVFFGKITHLAADDSSIVFYDNTSRRLVACDHKLNLKHFVGRAGQGPGEYVDVWQLSLRNGNIYIYMNKAITIYSPEGSFKRLINLDSYCTGAFAVDERENFIFTSWVGDSVRIVRTDTIGKTTASFGLYHQVSGSTFQQDCQHSRSLHIATHNYLVAVGQSYPSVETYSKEGRLLNLQMLDDSIIQLKYDNMVKGFAHSPGTISELYLDVCLYKEKLYLLYDNNLTGYQNCWLLIYDISPKAVQLARRYHLVMPDGEQSYFDKMCVLNDSIIVVTEWISASFCYFNIRN